MAGQPSITNCHPRRSQQTLESAQAPLDYDATEVTQGANDSYRSSLRCVAERPQYRVDTCLIAVTLSLEPREHVLIDAQRN